MILIMLSSLSTGFSERIAELLGEYSRLALHDRQCDESNMGVGTEAARDQRALQASVALARIQGQPHQRIHSETSRLCEQGRDVSPVAC